MDATRRGKPGPLADTAGAALRSRDHREELRQHLISAGAGNLLDFELLEVLLLAGNPRGDPEPTAKALLHQFGSFAEVLNADTEALAAAGLDTAAIATLALVHEATLRLMRAQLHARPVLNSWQQLIAYCNMEISCSNVEQFHLLLLDRRNALIMDERQQRGTVDQTAVYTREVVKRALDIGASGLILVHNHPSGDLAPSEADIATTRDIAKAAAPLGVILHDHIIIARGRHTSLRALGLF